jgi:hypothetical protein
MVRLKLQALSLYGKKVTDAIRANEPFLNQKCSCPPGESCSVEITEFPGRRIEAVVTRPRSVSEAQGWKTNAAASGMYRFIFDKRATAKRIREAVASIVAAALDNRRSQEELDDESEVLKIVLVDSHTLHRARNLIAGCQVCSPYAEIPFDSILDSVTDNDPSMTRYIVAEGSAKCPRCHRPLSEDTLVEFEPPLDEPTM